MEHPDSIKRSQGEEALRRGTRFEEGWRAILLLDLREGDIFYPRSSSGDDAEVRTADDRRIVWQMKYRSNAISAYDINNEFLPPAVTVLNADPAAEYELTIQGRLTDGASAALQTIANSYPARFRWKIAPVDDQTARDALRNRVLRVLRQRHPGRFRQSLISLSDLESVVDALIAHEFHIRDADQPTNAYETSEIIGLNALDRHLPERAAAGLVAWDNDSSVLPSYVRRLKMSTEQPSLSAFSRAIEQEVLDQINIWRRAPSARTRCLFLLGARDTGKSALLVRLANALQDVVPVYTAFTRHEGGRGFVDLASWTLRPTLVLIDDVFERDWWVPAYNAMVAQPTNVFIVATMRTAAPRTDLAEMRSALGDTIEVWDIPSLLTPGEKQGLRAGLRSDGEWTNGERERLARERLGPLLRQFTHDETPPDITGLLDAFADISNQSWLVPILIVSRAGLRLPSRLLRAFVRSDSGTALATMPAGLTGEVIRTELEPEEVTWIEQDVACAALETITEMSSRDEVKELEIRAGIRLLMMADVTTSADRTFARQYVRWLVEETSDGRAENIVRESRDAIVSMIVEDGDHDRLALAYSWIGAIGRLLDDGDYRESARKAVGALRAPKSAADVLLFAALLGNEATADLIKTTIATSSGWDAAVWADHIEVLTSLRKLDAGAARPLLKATIDAIQIAPLDFEHFLATREVAKELLVATADLGSFGHREWLTRKVFAQLSPAAHPRLPAFLAGNALNLLERALMQGRYGLSLRVPAWVLESMEADTMQSVRELVWTRYESCRRANELLLADSAPLQTALACATDLLRRSPAAASPIVAILMRSSGCCGGPAEIGLATDLASDLVRRAVEGNQLTAVLSVVNRLAYASLLSGRLDLTQDVRRNAGQLSPDVQMRLLLTSALGFARFVDPTSASAQAVRDWCERGSASPEVFSTSAAELEWDYRVDWASCVTRLTRKAFPRSFVALMLGTAARSQIFASIVTPEYLDQCEVTWQDSDCTFALVVFLLGIGQIDRARNVLRRTATHTAKETADAILLRAALAARSGHRFPAVELLAQVSSRPLGAGAHPPNVLRALSSLVGVSNGAEREVWMMTRALVAPRPLVRADQLRLTEADIEDAGEVEADEAL
jgi:hypothetical protein